MFFVYVFAFFVSFVLNFIIIKLSAKHFLDFLDFANSGVQKYHDEPTPRIGGFAIFVSILIGGGWLFINNANYTIEYIYFIISAIPVFLLGFLEDITKKISPKWRLLGGFISGVVAFYLLSASVNRIDILLIDDLLKISIISLLFTSFAVAGVSNAFNIIDGFNGLSTGTTMLIFGAYAYVSYLNNDYFLLNLSLISLFSILGFFVWNFPFGKIFLGDGGAYFLGFTAATIGILIVERHPEVSPWFPLLLVLYPVWETVFSIYRRRLLKGISPSLADATHLHSLIFKRLIRPKFNKDLKSSYRNSLTSPILWLMEVFCLIPAILFWNKTPILIMFSILFIAFYIWFYFRIVKFKTTSIFNKKFIFFIILYILLIFFLYYL